MLERVSAKEMAGWRAFDSVEPIGHWRTDYNTAMLCALYANANRKKGSAAFKPIDFMPFMPDNKDDKADDAFLILQQLAAAAPSGT